MECVNSFELLEIEDPLPPPPPGDPWEMIVGEPALVAHILCLTHRDLEWHELGFNTYQTNLRYGPPRMDEVDRHVVGRDAFALLMASRHVFALRNQEAFWQPLLKYCFPKAPHPPARRRRTWPPPLHGSELFILMFRRNMDCLKVNRKAFNRQELYVHYMNAKHLLEDEERENPGLPDEKPPLRDSIRVRENQMLLMEKLHIRELVTAAHMEGRMREWNPPRPKYAIRSITEGGWYSSDVVLDIPLDKI